MLQAYKVSVTVTLRNCIAFLTNMKQKEQTQTTPYSRKYKTKIIKIKIKEKNNAHHCRISKICCFTLFCLKWMRNVAANTYYSRY